MRCPSCGRENSDLATRCAACGSVLPDEPTTSTADSQAQPPASHSQPPASDVAPTANDDAQASTADTERLRSPSSPGGTAERPQPPLGAPDLSAEDPNLREAPEAAKKRTPSKPHRIGAFLSAHQRGLGIGLAIAVIAVLGIVWFALNMLDAPSYQKIEQDLASRLPSLEYAGGTFGPDLQIPLSGVAVTNRSATKTPEGMEAGEGIGSAAYGVEAEATYDDGRIRAVHNVGATYVRNNGEWAITGDLAERNVSYTARSGVDEQKVLNNASAILEAAGTSDGTSLADIYSDGTFSVVGNVFKEAADKNAATDDVTLHCKKEAGFYAYEGNVIAHFVFDSNTWSLRSAEASEQAAARTFSPLVGTWQGEFSSTTSNGASCYGARDNALEVTIESVGEPTGGRSQVQGTITTMAHFHKKLEKNADKSTGDTMLERVSFTGTIWAERDEGMGSNLTVECKTTGSTQGNVEFTLVFGTDEDPSTVLARVTSTHTYDEPILLFLPHQTTAKYIDTYTLSRS